MTLTLAESIALQGGPEIIESPIKRPRETKGEVEYDEQGTGLNNGGCCLTQEGDVKQRLRLHRHLLQL